jgi:regulator of RNase E activity RraA
LVLAFRDGRTYFPERGERDMDLLARYRLFDTSLVSDALDDHGFDGVIQGLAPAHTDFTAVGRARPMRFERVGGGRREEATNFPYAMLERLAADEVFVIDGVDDCSAWGGNASKLAAAAGLAGVVVDGGYRDVPDLRTEDLPVFGATPTPQTGQRRVRVESVGDPIEVRGVTVEAGDVVVADATGVVVVPQAEAAAVADTAEATLGEERLLEAKIDAGATVADLRDDAHEF